MCAKQPSTEGRSCLLKGSCCAKESVREEPLSQLENTLTLASPGCTHLT